MLYDLSKTYQTEQAKVRLDQLIKKGAKIELTEKKGKRTLQQNKYLHICVSIYAIEIGLTLDEAKTDLKRACHFMRYTKNDNTYLKRTRDMDTKELTQFIDWIRIHSSQQGIYIPTSEEYIQNRFEIDRDIERNKEYL